MLFHPGFDVICEAENVRHFSYMTLWISYFCQNYPNNALKAATCVVEEWCVFTAIT